MESLIERNTSKLADSKEGTQEQKKLHKKLKRLYRDAVKFKATKPSKEEREQAVKKFLKRLDQISDDYYLSFSCRRIAERLRKHRENMFRFVMVDGLDPDNNEAERGIRPNVVKRKISGGNRSPQGALAHAVNMSIIETCKRQNLNFFEFGSEYLQGQITSGSDKITS